MYSEYHFPIKSIQSDNGPEFIGREFQKFVTEHNLKHYFTYTQAWSKTSIPERYIRYLRTTAGKILAEKKVRTPIEAIKLACSIHNSTINKQLGNIAPKDVSIDNVGEILELRENRRLQLLAKLGGPPKAKYNKNDHVRKRQPYSKFTKSNDPVWSKKVYEVVDVLPTEPLHSYKLQDPSTFVQLPGTYSERQIINANNGT